VVASSNSNEQHHRNDVDTRCINSVTVVRPRRNTRGPGA
jgi:hypothetical protein